MRTLLALTLLAPLAGAQTTCPTIFDINLTGTGPWGPSSIPSDITAMGDERLFFRAADGVHGDELWSVGPTGAPSLAKPRDIWY